MSTTGDSAQPISGPTESGKECSDWQALLERIPYARHLGLEVQRDDVGLVVHMPCREALIGNFMLPALHGGVLGALIELTARVACWQGEKSKPIASGQVQLLLPTVAAKEADLHEQ